jgi:murein DD-endopeptidase MepM/ murein hydrolase activator NlpD
MVRRFLLSLLMLSLTASLCLSQTGNTPKVTLFEKDYYRYEVKAKETVYSLCKRFSVTEAELKAANPSLSEGLKIGQTLLIPVKSGTTVAPSPTSTGTTAAPARRHLSSPAKRPRITLLLPFTSGSNSGQNERYLEFYEGFLLAVDSLKSLGLSFEVQALEAGNDVTALNEYLRNGSLDNTDYCVGGVSPEQTRVLAEWARKNRRYLILPFSSHIPEVENNPYLYQTNTPPFLIQEKMAENLPNLTAGKNILFLRAPMDNTDARAAVYLRLQKELTAQHTAYAEVTDDETLGALSQRLSKDKPNLIVPSPGTLQETNNLLTRLAALKTTLPEVTLSLLGYPDWMAVGKTYQNHLYELNSTIYANFYADTQQKNVRNFQIAFSNTFNKSLLNTYPKYGMMGYDIAAYFVPRMVFERTEDLEVLPYLRPLQNAFRFGTTGPISGAYNNSVYFIHYAPDSEISVRIAH